MKIVNLFILCLCLGVTVAEDDDDWVDGSKLPIPHSVKDFFAGYLPVGSGRSYFYVFHHSESNPSKDPLVVQVSPGPGCSSLYSWLYSKGPFVFPPYTALLTPNNLNWNREANLLFIEGPPGVGFSTDTSGFNRSIYDEDFAH
jgi:carboxypeptidase C (cathepsin A)